MGVAKGSGDVPIPAGLSSNVGLASMTTLELGGPARHLCEASSEDAVAEAVRWAKNERLGLAVLGGGSNVVVSDRGFDGLVVRMANRGIGVRRDGDQTVVEAAAGEPWDELVSIAVHRDLAGIECLAGIPGLVGATPIQNVGAYGQEVASVIQSVRVLDVETGTARSLPAAACAFGYRTSRFRQRPGEAVVLGVKLRLRNGGAPTLAYDELRRAFGASSAPPPLAAVRDAVLELRRSKSMLLAEDDANRRSVGSFFVNPVVDGRTAEAVVDRALASGLAVSRDEVPRFAVRDGRVKLSAGWLIEKAGFEKGLRRGPVGLSSKHTLALVHHGGGTTADLVALAREIRVGVDARFGVSLQPEPVFLGFDSPNPLDRDF